MGLHVGIVAVFVSFETGSLDYQFKDAAHVAVHYSFVERTVFHSFDDVGGLFLGARFQHVVACNHLGGSVGSSPPVGHDGAFISPFFTQDGGE